VTGTEVPPKAAVGVETEEPPDDLGRDRLAAGRTRPQPTRVGVLRPEVFQGIVRREERRRDKIAMALKNSYTALDISARNPAFPGCATGDHAIGQCSLQYCALPCAIRAL
jgi:hypothetical protein